MKSTAWIILLIVLFFVVFECNTCTDETGARKTLVRSGYKPLEVGGYGFLQGSKEDVYKTKFKAIAQNGDTVTGCVTRGWFKGNTIRLDD